MRGYNPSFFPFLNPIIEDQASKLKILTKKFPSILCTLKQPQSQIYENMTSSSLLKVRRITHNPLKTLIPARIYDYPIYLLPLHIPPGAPIRGAAI